MTVAESLDVAKALLGQAPEKRMNQRGKIATVGALSA
jgi:hypothetical protein